MNGATPLQLPRPSDTTLQEQPAWTLQPGTPLRLTSDDWSHGRVLHALVRQRGPNHSRLELRWFVKNAEEPRLTITFGFLPDLTATLLYDLRHLDANTLFLPRTPGRLKATSLGQRVDRDEISHAELRLIDVGTDQFLLLTQPGLSDTPPDPLRPDKPMLDSLGQLATRDWPGKQTTLARRDPPPAPKPVAEPTSWFRVHCGDDGRFHLLDPNGNPFFSVGVDCVNPGNGSYIVSGDEGMLPRGWDTAPLLARHTTRNEDHLLVNFGTANLERMFGTDWRQHWERVTTSRLRHWGFNTIGNWSDPDYAARSGLPFVLPLKKYPATDTRLFRDLPDVFDPVFASRAKHYAAQLEPWVRHRNLIGTFMINEPKWGFGGFNLASEMLEDHPGTHARRALARWISSRYHGDTAAWIQAWRLERGTWEFEHLEHRCVHRMVERHPGSAPDLSEFSRELVRRFVRIPAEALRAVDPHHLNLGMRWAWISSDLCYESATVADVFSLNCYGMEPPVAEAAEVARRNGIPTLIGEFHFGALDRGLTGTGLRGVAGQVDRGAAYRHFVESCAADPNLVGCHYFQYNDQSAIGRFDGECWNIGLVDVCNQPYSELVDAARETHARLEGLATGDLKPVEATAREVGRVAF